MIMWYCWFNDQLQNPSSGETSHVPSTCETWKSSKLYRGLKTFEIKEPQKKMQEQNQNGFVVSVMMCETKSPPSPKLIRKEGGKHLEWMIRLKPEHWPWHMPEKQQGSTEKPDEAFTRQSYSERENLVGFNINSTRAGKGREKSWVCVHIVTGIQPYQDSSGSVYCLVLVLWIVFWFWTIWSKTCFTFGSFSQ